ncbi:MAG TPA: nucleoside triphosphate pyrophosphatase [Pirellulales bacterium]|jgi:septum formation protein|nr:nucleoside triphosphate pyrophosphatase [Pirellulales bacterium]
MPPHQLPLATCHLSLILASRSPRRRELLAEAGYQFEVVPPSCAEENMPDHAESPADYVARLARAKAADVVRQMGRGVVLGCDTVAVCKGQILGKPESAEAARRMLELLSGREHRVLTGICVWSAPAGEPLTRVALTTLRMDRLSTEQLAEYVSSRQWEGKAGGFGYQDRLGWVHIVEGSPSNVVGLPLELLAEMLKQVCAG